MSTNRLTTNGFVRVDSVQKDLLHKHRRSLGQSIVEQRSSFQLISAKSNLNSNYFSQP